MCVVRLRVCVLADRLWQIMLFSTLAESLKDHAGSDGELVEALSSVALLVRGRWLAKSNLVCGGSHMLECARDYVLSLFVETGRDTPASVSYTEEPLVDLSETAAVRVEPELLSDVN